VAAIVPGLLIIVPPFISIYRTGRRIASPLTGCIFTVLTCITLLFSGELTTTARPI
jgi:hypothetical protein